MVNKPLIMPYFWERGTLGGVGWPAIKSSLFQDGALIKPSWSTANYSGLAGPKVPSDKLTWQLNITIFNTVGHKYMINWPIFQPAMLVYRTLIYRGVYQNMAAMCMKPPKWCLQPFGQTNFSKRPGPTCQALQWVCRNEGEQWPVDPG